MLQWRCKTVIGREQIEQVDRLAALCQRHSATLIVNDRADVAMITGAQGLHVGQDDLTPEMARRLLGVSAIVGHSTHNRDQFLTGAKLPVDYVALGPIFGTANKANPDPVVGLDELQLCAGLTSLPTVAIGGITRSNAGEVLRAGAASLAVIGDLIPDQCDADSLRHRFHEWLRIL